MLRTRKVGIRGQAAGAALIRVFGKSAPDRRYGLATLSSSVQRRGQQHYILD